MLSSGLLLLVDLVRTDVSEERSATIIKVRENVVPSSQLRSSEMSVLTRATRRNVPEDGILHSH
jgi:hypothetical protein